MKEMKEQLLATARMQIEATREVVKKETNDTKRAVQQYRKSAFGLDEPVRQKLLAHFSDRLDQLEHLYPSPYFSRCDICSETGEKKTFYFSKFPLIEESIFSWTAPAARLRFEEIGPVWLGALDRKDQFMIIDGKIVFMTSEAKEYGRTLVYQETLSKQKPGFILPEIVERMERAQDDVIRAAVDGPLLISGPAGSGKTTLAFHRIAYLLQSPETASKFTSQNVIVFVQDERTKMYFSKLLPELGIHEVQVTTFGQWALRQLGLENFTFVRRPNGIDPKWDAFEIHKAAAMQHASALKNSKDPKKKLEQVYTNEFSPDEKGLLKEQLDRMELDRFDVTILLRDLKKQKGLMQEKECFEAKKNFEIRRRTKTVPVEYALIVVDEVQNYLLEQLALLQSCVSLQTNALLSVGDLGQQVFLGTIRDWADVRQITLEKVYRSTRNILTYIQSCGFSISIPDGLREGLDVVERTQTHDARDLQWIKKIVEETDKKTHIGILSPLAQLLSPFQDAFKDRENIHVLTAHESQGVEFEKVILIGFSKEFFEVSLQDETADEIKRIKRDLYYVALTRAMDELYVIT